MASYLKDKKVELWRNCDRETDEDGFPVEDAKKIASLWAYYRHASSKEVYEAATIKFQVDVVFIINYREDINPKTDYLVFHGKEYLITAMDDYEGGRKDLKITARYKK